jgi:glutaredoxin
VVLYVVPSCPLCARTRAWLDRHNVSHAVRDVSEDYGAMRTMYKLTRQKLVPVLHCGAGVFVRPTEEELESFLLA